MSSIGSFGAVSSPNAGGALSRLTEVIADGTTVGVTLSIPAGYRHLRIIYQARSDVAATGEALFLQFNGDIGANYDSVRSQIAAPGVVSTELIGVTLASAGFITAANSPANAASMGEIVIPYYTGATFRKTYTGNSYVEILDSAGNPSRYVTGGDWRSTAPITSVTLFLATGNGNLVLGSAFSAYGMA